MMLSPFDHQRDEELGRVLREQLTGPAPEAFLRRLRHELAGAERATQWDVLSGWSRPRVMAAAIAAALLLWLGAWLERGRIPEDQGALLSAQSVVGPQPPRADEIMMALRERR